MSEAELIETFYLMLGNADAQFETWMGVTIAVVVSAYTAGDKLNTMVRMVIAALYVFICALLYIRYTVAVENLRTLIQLLEEAGSFHEFGDTSFLPTLRVLVVVGTTLLAVLMIAAPKLVTNRNRDT
jgi:hypothetical protein